MGFESRSAPGRSYMYLGVRDPATGGVRKLYLGAGREAEAAAEAIAYRRSRRDAGRQAVLDAMALTRDADALAAELDGAATLLMEAVLLTWGWHRPNYGPWRRRRHGRD